MENNYELECLREVKKEFKDDNLEEALIRLHELKVYQDSRNYEDIGKFLSETDFFSIKRVDIFLKIRWHEDYMGIIQDVRELKREKYMLGSYLYVDSKERVGRIGSLRAKISFYLDSIESEIVYKMEMKKRESVFYEK